MHALRHLARRRRRSRTDHRRIVLRRKPNETRVLLRSEQAVIPIAVAEVADAEMNILASAVAKVFDKQ